jgi:hypothetical protein
MAFHHVFDFTVTSMWQCQLLGNKQRAKAYMDLLKEATDKKNSGQTE